MVPAAYFADTQHLAIADHSRVLAAQVLGHLSVLVEEFCLAVHWQEVLRLDELQQLRQLLLLGVPTAGCSSVKIG